MCYTPPYIFKIFLLDGVKNMKKISIICYAFVLIAVTACNNAGSSNPSAQKQISNVKTDTDLIKKTAASDVLYNVVSTKYTFVPNSNDGLKGGVVYKNGTPLAVDPLAGYLSTNQSAFGVSPITVDDKIFITNLYGINYANVGYLIPGSKTPFDGWKSINISDLQSYNEKKQAYLLSPMISGSRLNGASTTINSVYIVTEDEDQYLHIFRASDGGLDSLSPSFEPFDNNGISDSQYKQNPNYYTAPIAIAEPSNLTGGDTYIYTAAGPNGSGGDNLLAMRIPNGSSPTYSLINASIFLGFGVDIGARKIIALTVANNVLFMELSDGTLYSSNTLIPRYISFSQLSSSNSQANQPFQLCHLDVNNPYNNPANPIQSNNIQSNLMIQIPSVMTTGVYLCGGDSVYRVSKPLMTLDGYQVQQFFIPKSDPDTYLTNIVATTGELFAIARVENTTSAAQYNLLYMPNSENGVNNAWYFIDKYYPIDREKPITSLGVGAGNNLFANVKTLNLDDDLRARSLLLATSVATPNDQWFSVGSNFILESTSDELYIAYTDYSQSLFDGPDITQSGPGFIIATDGTHWWAYYQDWFAQFPDSKTWKPLNNFAPINYPAGDANDSPVQLVQNYFFIYVLTKNGYVLYLNSDINQQGATWSVLYDPTKVVNDGFKDTFAGPAKKINTVPFVKRSVNQGGWLYFRTESDDGTGHLLYGIGNTNNVTPEINYFDNNLGVNYLDFNITNTDPKYNDLPHTALTGLDNQGNISQVIWGPAPNGVWRIIEKGLLPEDGSNLSLYVPCASYSIGSQNANNIGIDYPESQYPFSISSVDGYPAVTIDFTWQNPGESQINQAVSLIADNLPQNGELLAFEIVRINNMWGDATQDEEIVLLAVLANDHIMVSSIPVSRFTNELEYYAMIRRALPSAIMMSGYTETFLPVLGEYNARDYARAPREMVLSWITGATRDRLSPAGSQNLIRAVLNFVNTYLATRGNDENKKPPDKDPGSSGASCVIIPMPTRMHELE